MLKRKNKTNYQKNTEKYSLGIKIIDETSNEKNVAVFLESIHLLNYKFDKYKKLKKHRFKFLFKKNKYFKKEIIEGVFLARDLVNEPLSFLTAVQLSKEIKFSKVHLIN